MAMLTAIIRWQPIYKLLRKAASLLNKVENNYYDVAKGEKC